MKHTAIALLLLVACGGGDESSSEGTAGDEETVIVDDSDTPTRFAEMSDEQKLAFMQTTVMPEMTALFQEFDAERYADFTCATCHGEDMQEVGFQMPNGLAPLNPEQIPAMFQSDQPMAQFMTQTVWPRMYEMLGAAPYNPETHEGFACLSCHATEGG